MQQLLAHLVGNAQVTMAFEGWDQLGEKWHQTLGADPVRRRPRGRQCLLDRGAVVAHSGPPDRLRRADRTEKQANRVLALIAGDSDELIQDDRALPVPRRQIPWRHLDQQLAFGAKAHR